MIVRSAVNVMLVYLQTMSQARKPLLAKKGQAPTESDTIVTAIRACQYGPIRGNKMFKEIVNEMFKETVSFVCVETY